MTSAPEAISPPATVTVALLGHRVPSAQSLHRALRDLPAAARAWSIADGDSLPAHADVQIAVCDAELVFVAIGRWPAASTLALVPDRADSEAVLRAIGDGANVCTRAGETLLVAAFVNSLARRCATLGEQGARR